MILEAADGRVAAIEVKASSSVNDGDERSLAYLRDRLGDRFVHGVVLHLGERATPLADRLTALPIGALWA